VYALWLSLDDGCDGFPAQKMKAVFGFVFAEACVFGCRSTFTETPVTVAYYGERHECVACHTHTRITCHTHVSHFTLSHTYHMSHTRSHVSHVSHVTHMYHMSHANTHHTSHTRITHASHVAHTRVTRYTGAMHVADVGPLALVQVCDDA